MSQLFWIIHPMHCTVSGFLSKVGHLTFLKQFVNAVSTTTENPFTYIVFGWGQKSWTWSLSVKFSISLRGNYTLTFRSPAPSCHDWPPKPPSQSACVAIWSLSLWAAICPLLSRSPPTDWSSQHLQEWHLLSGGGGSETAIIHHQPDPGCNQCF